jgi:hypothetical protein
MIGELFELLEWIKGAISGWRFLFSRHYRKQILEGWKNESWYYIAGDIICATAGMVFSLLPVGLLVYVFLSD